jgi:hypothetical protein
MHLATPKSDRIVVGALFLFGILTRLPFTGQILYHWDSVNFAFGLRHFDVAAAQPHVPGYILYVFFGQLINALVRSEPATLVGVSVLSSGLATAMLYILGSDLFDRKTGLLAALFLASSPLFWFYGEIALPHALDTFAVILAVWLLYRLAQGQTTLTIPAAAWLAVAGGLRPQTELFLAPLALYVAFRIGWKHRLIALGTLVIVNLAWFVPLMALTGGIGRYLEVMGSFTKAFNTTTSVLSGGLWGLTRNLRKLGMYTLYGWGFAALPAAVWAARSAPTAWKARLAMFKDVRVWVMILWIFPTAGYYTLIHMGQQGLVFVFLPALLLLSAAGLALIPKNWERLATPLAIAVILANALTFIAAPTYPLGSETPKLLTVSTLREHDAEYQARFAAIRQNFPPESTVLLSSSWRFLEYYLPDYKIITYDIGARWEINAGTPVIEGETQVDAASLGLIPDPKGQYHLVVFDHDLEAFNRSLNRQEQINLSNGESLAHIRFEPTEKVLITSQFFAINP